MKKGKENLRQRAYLNTITSFIDYGSRAFSSFFVNPFVVNGLGSSTFGIWQILTQITNYSNLVDLRASTVLTWAVARDRESADENNLRDYLTTTFFLVVFMLPLILIFASIIVWFLPSFIEINSGDVLTVRITFLILIIAFILNKFVGVLEALLKGMNLSYKRMGLRASITLLSGGLSVLSVVLGFGLSSLAVVHLFSSILIGFSLWLIIKKNVPWFGFNRFNFNKSKEFMKTSGWFMAWSFIQMIMTNSDKILLGIFASPIYVSKYVLTFYMPNTIKDIVSQVISSTLPGVGKLYGNKELDKLIKVKQNIFIITWLFCCVLGCMVLLYNESFIKLWVGPNHFAGQIVNLLLIIVTIQYMLTYNDGILINISLNVKKKVTYGAFSAIITLGLSCLLISKYGILGLSISIIFGRLIMSIGYPIIVAKILDHKISLDFRLLRKIFVMALLFCVSYFCGQDININSWLVLIFYAFISFLGLIGCAFFLGITKSERIDIINNLKKVKPLSNND